MTTILHTYSVPEMASAQETFLAIDNLSRTFTIQSSACMEDDDYYKAILRYWNKGEDLILIEQDIVPTVDMLYSLLYCRSGLCTFPYRLGSNMLSIWTPLRGPVVDRYDRFGKLDLGVLNEYQSMHHYSTVPAYAEGSGLGLVKIGKGIQARVPLEEYPVKNHHWSFLDTWLSLYIFHYQGAMWEVHEGLVKHNHQY